MPCAAGLSDPICHLTKAQSSLKARTAMPDRRTFLASAATLAAASAVSWGGWQYLNRLPPVNIRYAGLPGGHLLRDGRLNQTINSRHRCQTLILGSGAAGLGAAWSLARHGHRDVLLADGFERNGNNAAFHTRLHGETLAAPTGAHYLAQPSAESGHVRLLLRDLGILLDETADGRTHYRETDLVHAPDERVFYQGRWIDGLLPVHDQDSRRFFALVEQLRHARGSDGLKLFAIPIALSSQEPRWRQLDGYSFAQWLAAEGYRSPHLLHYLDYCCRDDYGQGLAAVSAFAGLHYFCARGNEQAAVLTWADGLNHLSEGMRRLAGMQHLDAPPSGEQWRFDRPASLAAAAWSVREQDDGVEVLLHHFPSGRNLAVHAGRMICAMPLHVAARIVNTPAAYGFRLPETLPANAPWLVANFVLQRFPDEAAGSELAWDNIVHGSQGLGYVAAGHQQIRVAKPPATVFTAYAALNHDTPANVRRQLLHADRDELLPLAAQDLLAVYGRDFWPQVAAVDITVRGHGMAVPQAGYLDNPVLHALRRHRSRLLFAHSDLSGYSVFEEALWWGVEAARQIMAEAA